MSIFRILSGVLLGSYFACAVNAAVYPVGPNQPYTEVDTVPWESLNPGDIVEIHWRSTPYRSKWVIARAGTASQPITVRGIPHANGQRPVISGDGASTRLALSFWNEDRGVIKIGGSSIPSGPGQHIVIESLEIRAAHPSYSFTNDNGNAGSYRNNAAAIFIEHGEHVVIRDCILTDSGNGLFIANLSQDITVEFSYLHGNGISGSIFEHNSY
ncbi:MAG: polysaccharide-degrading enzyme, partial [Pseudomonadota bacterium]